MMAVRGFTYPDPSTLRSPTARETPFDLAKIEDFIARCCMSFPAHEEALAGRGVAAPA